MLKKFSYLLLILSLVYFTSCTEKEVFEKQQVDNIDFETLEIPSSMKGWELYSWPNGGDWNYSLLPGTNRLKSLEEVMSNELIVCGKDSLKMLLSRLPEYQYVSWIDREWLETCWNNNDYGTLSLPDALTILEIKVYCSENDIQLSVK